MLYNVYSMVISVFMAKNWLLSEEFFFFSSSVGIFSLKMVSTNSMGVLYTEGMPRSSKPRNWKTGGRR